MALSKSLKERLEEFKKTDDYWINSAKLDFAITIEAKRRECGMSNAELARALNTSNAYISKVLRGDTNLTIESMVKLSRAVGYNLEIKLQSLSEKKMISTTESILSSEYQKLTAINQSANDPTYLYAA